MNKDQILKYGFGGGTSEPITQGHDKYNLNLKLPIP
jgi:hypothetical protein